MRALFISLALIAVGCGYKTIDSPSNTVLMEFKLATPILMTNPSETDQTKRAWDHSIPLQNGVSARITAHGWIGGRFSVQYSDEASPRFAGVPGDYVYPAEVRVDRDRRLLYGLARGYRPIGDEPVTLLFVFDLQQRTAIHSYKIENKLILNH